MSRHSKVTSGRNWYFDYSIDSFLPVRACCHASKSSEVGRLYLILDFSRSILCCNHFDPPKFCDILRRLYTAPELKFYSQLLMKGGGRGNLKPTQIVIYHHGLMDVSQDGLVALETIRYHYQPPPGQINHSCSGAEVWADVRSTTEIFCPSGYYCPTTALKLPCNKGHYCRTGSTSQTSCYKLAICESKSSNQNITAYGIMFFEVTGSSLGNSLVEMQVTTNQQASPITCFFFKYAYGQIEKEKALQEQNKDLTFSGVISMASAIEIRTRPPIEVCFKDLTLTLKGKTKHLLRCVSGKLSPGRVSAVMGPSGAGKTTFLSALTGKAAGCTVIGVILINGKPEPVQSYKKIIGFVPQDDIVHENLTVEENLWFSARCRYAIVVLLLRIYAFI
ncbi:hypothetical protein FXO38_25905 [Capsicum annuum]|nr:hypothetical protein FXO38_25905 [Capsicum annuum]